MEVLTLRIGEVNHIIVDENVHLLNARDRVDAQSLKSALQPFIIRPACFMDCLLLPARESGDEAIRPHLGRNF